MPGIRQDPDDLVRPPARPSTSAAVREMAHPHAACKHGVIRCRPGQPGSVPSQPVSRSPSPAAGAGRRGGTRRLLRHSRRDHDRPTCSHAAARIRSASSRSSASVRRATSPPNPARASIPSARRRRTSPASAAASCPSASNGPSASSGPAASKDPSAPNGPSRRRLSSASAAASSSAPLLRAASDASAAGTPFTRSAAWLARADRPRRASSAACRSAKRPSSTIPWDATVRTTSAISAPERDAATPTASGSAPASASARRSQRPTARSSMRRSPTSVVSNRARCASASARNRVPSGAAPGGRTLSFLAAAPAPPTRSVALLTAAPADPHPRPSATGSS